MPRSSDAVSSRRYPKMKMPFSLSSACLSDKEVAVPSFRRRASVIDADRVDEPPDEPDGHQRHRRRARARGGGRGRGRRSRGDRRRRPCAGPRDPAAPGSRAAASRRRRAAADTETVEAPIRATTDGRGSRRSAAATPTRTTVADDSSGRGDASAEPARRARGCDFALRSWKAVAAALAVLCTCAVDRGERAHVHAASQRAARDQQRSAPSTPRPPGRAS